MPPPWQARAPRHAIRPLSVCQLPPCCDMFCRSPFGAHAHTRARRLRGSKTKIDRRSVSASPHCHTAVARPTLNSFDQTWPGTERVWKDLEQMWPDWGGGTVMTLESLPGDSARQLLGADSGSPFWAPPDAAGARTLHASTREFRCSPIARTLEAAGA